ncbi:MAG: hypothetical protein ACYDC1_09455 [Limisphaerales bacterium]
MNTPSRDELMATKAQREAYLRWRFTPEELWRWQQAALESLARLRPDGARPDRNRPPMAVATDSKTQAS